MVHYFCVKNRSLTFQLGNDGSVHKQYKLILQKCTVAVYDGIISHSGHLDCNTNIPQ